ncbi:transcription factor FET5 [Capsaspora owczarzaki ATCC 30864]|nr:transcription factor FET5 [Capsaspora owczarzaki ATCC 30864]|eukprot:XP_004348321.2 transcription factor FET5 [Capsaspora owczarzaki ATCC 30864]
MEECQLGPNGSLIYCMEWLLNHITYLTDELDGYADNSYFLFDCPGQIELYVHLPIVPRIVQLLDQRFVRSATVFLLDSQCVNDIPKYVSGALSAMTTMLNMGLPQLNILSKLDLFQQPLSRLQLQRFLDGDVTTVMQAANHAMPAKFRRLNERIAPTLDDYGLLGFLPLNYLDIDTLERVLYQMDAIVQHGDELEPAGKDLREERDESQELFEAMQGNKDDMIRELLERRPNDPTA